MKKGPKTFLLVMSIACFSTMTAYSSWVVNQYSYSHDGTLPLDLEPVAYIVGNPDVKYTSIERALEVAQSGDIVAIIPPNDKNYNDSTNPYTPDKVTYEITRNCTIKSGVTLVVPTDSDSFSSVTNASTLNTFIKSMYDDSSRTSENVTRGTNSTYSSYAFGTNKENQYLRVTIKVAEDVVITNNGTLVVSGYLGGGSGANLIGHTSHSFSKIVLGKNAKIVQDNSSATTYCLGYITEETANNGSEVNINNGNLYQPFIICDYRGFYFSVSLTGNDGAINSEKCSAFNQIEFSNIQSILNLGYNSKVYAINNLYMVYTGGGLDKNVCNIISLVGNTSSFCFQFTESSYSSLKYKYNNATKVANIDFYGGVKMNPLNLSIEATFKVSGISTTQKVDLSTKNSYFPLSYRQQVTVNVAQGQSSCTVDLTQQRLKIMTGSSLTVGEGVTLNANEIIVYSAFYDGTKGNGQGYANGYNGQAYPLKEGGTFIVKNTAVVSANALGGTIYSDSGNITSTSTSITAKEAWSFGSGPVTKPWDTNEYLMLKEDLNKVPESYFSKKKIFCGVNIFQTVSSYSPVADVLINKGTSTESTQSVNQSQKVLFSDTLSTASIEFKNNIYYAYKNSTFYNYGETISVSSGNLIIGLIGSKNSISSNANGVNEFLAQSIEIVCTTPEVNGVIPLFVDSTINLVANVVDEEKVYEKTAKWTSLDPSIATVDSNGNVTGVSLGTVIIQAERGGKVAQYEATVREEVKIVDLESIYITDQNGRSSNVISGQTDKGADVNGSYSNGDNVVFTVNFNPTDANYSYIKWTFTASAAGRQYVNDSTLQVNTVENSLTVTVHIVSDSGKDDDTCTLKCEVTDLSGNTRSASFKLCHEADFAVCFEKGTLLSTKNGLKRVEDLEKTDLILSFNHFTGVYEYKPISLVVNHGKNIYDVIELRFDDGGYIGFIESHGLFDLNLNCYVEFTPEHYSKFIGHQFIKYEKGVEKQVKLISAKLVSKETESYTVMTSENLNCVANGLLNMTTILHGIYNIFGYDDDHKYVESELQNDINAYGLYSFEDFKDKITEKVFDNFGFKWFKISIGKGKLTEEVLDYYINWFYSLIQSGEAVIYDV